MAGDVWMVGVKGEWVWGCGLWVTGVDVRCEGFVGY